MYDYFILKGVLKMIYYFLEVDREVNWNCVYDYGCSWIWEYFKNLIIGFDLCSLFVDFKVMFLFIFEKFFRVFFYGNI